MLRIDTASTKDIMGAIGGMGIRDGATHDGKFIFLEWKSEEAYRDAQALIASPGELTADKLNRYYSHASEVYVAPNIGITAGLTQVLNAASALTTTVTFGGPASSSNHAFMGIGNGTTAVTAADTDLSGASKSYKGIDPSFPTESLYNGKATLIWQSTFASGDAQFAWNEALIAATTGTVPPAGAGNSAVTVIPSSSTLLAHMLWTPSPLTKGTAVVSAQYSFSVS
jgi:hypothetical protein